MSPLCSRSLATSDARRVLPDSVPRADATFNLGRIGLLLAGLAEPSVLTSATTGDRLHQDARTTLFPEAPALLAALVEAGALASCWSGAGPTLLGITTQTALAGVSDRVRGRRWRLSVSRPACCGYRLTEMGWSTATRRSCPR